jgi:hypothetical protein
MVTRQRAVLAINIVQQASQANSRHQQAIFYGRIVFVGVLIA